MESNAAKDAHRADANKPLAKPLAWVYEKDGRPYVRWWNVVRFLVAVVLVQVLSLAAMSWWNRMPLRVEPLLVPLCGMIGMLIVVVELQRQYVLTGHWRFRLGLGAILLCTTLFCLFAGILGSTLRRTQALNESSQLVQKQLEAVIGEGTVSMGTLEGGTITCHVARKSFSDADLAKLITLSMRQANRPSELTALFLGGTQITDAGVKQLRACTRLTLLELPSLSLSDESIDVLCGCEKLQFLFLDEKLITPEQRTRLKEALPKVKLNGVPWK